jgi:DNA-binding NarL/FixJ family response regulator
MTSRPIRIVLADDHPIVRQGLRALLETEPDLAVVGETGDGLDALALVERLEPDILVVDVMMPGIGGIEVTRQVARRRGSTRVVVLSVHSEEVYALEAFRNDASAYVAKGASAAELLVALREVAAGRRYLSPPLADKAVEHYAEKAKAGPADLYGTLTTREREFLCLAAQGLTNAEVAQRLGISSRTAESHGAHVLRKLRLRSRCELVRYAVAKGIVSAGAGRQPGR